MLELFRQLRLRAEQVEKTFRSDMVAAQVQRAEVGCLDVLSKYGALCGGQKCPIQTELGQALVEVVET